MRNMKSAAAGCYRSNDLKGSERQPDEVIRSRESLHRTRGKTATARSSRFYNYSGVHNERNSISHWPSKKTTRLGSSLTACLHLIKHPLANSHPASFAAVSFHPHRLHDHELPQTEIRKLAAVSRHHYSDERQPRIALDQAVDE